MAAARGAVRRDEAQHDVRELRFMEVTVASLAWMLPTFQRRIHDSHSLPRIHHVVQSGRELLDRGRRCPAVLHDVISVFGPGLPQQNDVCLAACTICTYMSEPRSMMKATVNVVASLALP